MKRTLGMLAVSSIVFVAACGEQECGHLYQKGDIVIMRAFNKPIMITHTYCHFGEPKYKARSEATLRVRTIDEYELAPTPPKGETE